MYNRFYISKFHIIIFRKEKLRIENVAKLIFLRIVLCLLFSIGKQIVYLFIIGAVAKLIFVSNYIFRTNTEKTIFANLKTFCYGAVAKVDENLL